MKIIYVKTKIGSKEKISVTSSSMVYYNIHK